MLTLYKARSLSAESRVASAMQRAYARKIERVRARVIYSYMLIRWRSDKALAFEFGFERRAPRGP